MICPKDNKPCIDDICYGCGCVQMDGYPMLKICDICHGTIDSEILDLGTCTCDEDDDFYDDV